MSELPKISDLLKHPEQMRVMCGEACGHKPKQKFAVWFNGTKSDGAIFDTPEKAAEGKKSAEDDFKKFGSAVTVSEVEPYEDWLHVGPRYHESLDAMAEAEATLTDEEYRAYAKLFIQQAETASAIQRLVFFLIAKGLTQP